MQLDKVIAMIINSLSILMSKGYILIGRLCVISSKQTSDAR